MLKVIGIDNEIKMVIPLYNIARVQQLNGNIVILFHKGEIYRVKKVGINRILGGFYYEL